ncbi:rhodanese-like domain-containing protein [Jannaschia sp. W003]|uniref:rhodanese-like domain-containing protein n=1 Tax=Jannaschia sp. W003 TaxID=2867012 RepID=UPI0021A40010|nr:rhodanese-like domain-containing protein [Jannaschia sp. W003]UWQ21699.1 rhodanese-like domain-containing protein [Jannaschia sp. W003]
MAKSSKDYVAEAKASVETLDHEALRRKVEAGALVVDVRDPTEVAASGRIPGAANVSRGMLEFRADPDSPYHDARFAKDREVVVYCASGGRAALAAKTLGEMGYEKVWSGGGFKEWQEAGGEVEEAEE